MVTNADDLVVSFLKEHRLGVLATGRRDGSPQQSLIGYQFDGSDFVISARAPSAKAKNIRKRPGVSLAVNDGGSVVIVFGRARVVRDFDEVLRYNLTRLGAFRRGSGPVDEDALAQRLRAEERVVIVISPEKYIPSRLGPRA